MAFGETCAEGSGEPAPLSIEALEAELTTLSGHLNAANHRLLAMWRGGWRATGA